MQLTWKFDTADGTLPYASVDSSQINVFTGDLQYISDPLTAGHVTTLVATVVPNPNLIVSLAAPVTATQVIEIHCAIDSILPTVNPLPNVSYAIGNS